MSETINETNWRLVPLYENPIYADMNAGHAYDRQIQKIEEREAVHRLHRAFIEKHVETLAGMHWEVGYLDPEIEISWHSYRGCKATPETIAALWPGAKWVRKKSKWSSKTAYDWVAMVDGIDLIIKEAEDEEPRPKLKVGERIKIGGAKA